MSAVVAEPCVQIADDTGVSGGKQANCCSIAWSVNARPTA